MGDATDGPRPVLSEIDKHLVARANAASKAVGRHMVMMVGVLAYLLCVAIWRIEGVAVDVPGAGFKVPMQGLFVTGIGVLLVVYTATQAMLNDLADTLSRYDISTFGKWDQVLPANRVLEPAFVVFAWYGSRPMRLLSGAVCRVLAPCGLAILGVILFWRRSDHWGTVSAGAGSALAMVIGSYFWARACRLRKERRRELVETLPSRSSQALAKLWWWKPQRERKGKTQNTSEGNGAGA